MVFLTYHISTNILIHRLIGSLLIGYASSSSSSNEEEVEESDQATSTTQDFSFAVPAPRPPPPSSSTAGEIPSLLRSYKISNSDIEDDINPWEK
jgi:hypothetical protein